MPRFAPPIKVFAFSKRNLQAHVPLQKVKREGTAHWLEFRPQYIQLTVLCKSNGSEFWRNSCFVLLKIPGKFGEFSLEISHIFFFFIQQLSRGIQFSRASLNGALTKHKNRDIKIRQLIKLRQQVTEKLLFKVAL